MMLGLEESEWFLKDYNEFTDFLVEEEFVSLAFDVPNEHNILLLKQALIDRNLHIADGVLGVSFEDSCPLQIPTDQMEESQINQVIENKQRGHELFEKGNYEDAIRFYVEAYMTFAGLDMPIAPKEHVEQIVAIISSHAECQLRLHIYSDAAETATNALIFMGDHEKSQICRAKVGLAIGKQKECKRPSEGHYYFVQARKDLEEVFLNTDFILAEGKACENLMTQVDTHL